jgi:hypothetical protein
MTRRVAEDFLNAPNRFAGQDLPRLAVWDRSSETEKAASKWFCRDWSPNRCSFISKSNVDGGMAHPRASKNSDAEVKGR